MSERRSVDVYVVVAGRTTATASFAIKDLIFEEYWDLDQVAGVIKNKIKEIDAQVLAQAKVNNTVPWNGAFCCV